MPDDITLKEFMDLRFKAIEKELAQLREAILGDLKALRERVDGLEDRVQNHESTLKVYRYIGGLIVAIVTALVIAWLRDIFGL